MPTGWQWGGLPRDSEHAQLRLKLKRRERSSLNAVLANHVHRVTPRRGQEAGPRIPQFLWNRRHGDGRRNRGCRNRWRRQRFGHHFDDRSPVLCGLLGEDICNSFDVHACVAFDDCGPIIGPPHGSDTHVAASRRPYLLLTHETTVDRQVSALSEKRRARPPARVSGDSDLGRRCVPHGNVGHACAATRSMANHHQALDLVNH